jgi:hypothetical protein
MGPFQKSKNCEYILVIVDYVSKWVEAMSCRADDAKSYKKMFEETIFPCFGVPRMVISDGGTHFIGKNFRKYLSKHCYSISPSDMWPSRNIEQTNQEHSIEDGQQDGDCMEG